ncbi:MAG: glycosyltransferase family 2 protein [Cyanobacteria bacterium]|nr:glycosyltransferase family 2 protein [Cyanobacteriota bacterium]
MSFAPSAYHSDESLDEEGVSNTSLGVTHHPGALSRYAAPKVFVILLNYKGVEDTLACLKSLRHLNYPNFYTIVVDNASGDGSFERLQQVQNLPESEKFTIDFLLIAADSNLGYSGGNNLGICYALSQGAEFVWLLNNDTTVETETLRFLIAQAQETNGLVGSVLYYPDGEYQRIGTRLNWLTGGVRGYSEKSIKEGKSVENLTGASMLIPREALETVGLLDETYFLYFEDGEYSLRAKRGGFKTTIAKESRVYHKEGATTGRTSYLTEYYYHRNRLRMFCDYANKAQRFCILLYTGVRLCRTWLKAVSSGNPDVNRSLRTQWLAISDFWKGIQGPCPHRL